MREKISHLAWPVIGLLVAALCIWLLVHELRSISLDDVMVSLGRISWLHWLGAFLGALVAYGALAGYDRIALIHLGKKNISWPFIAVASFVAYALSHNIGAAVVSGAVIRYRAYSTKGLNAAEVAVLVAVCAFTFGLGIVILGGILLTIWPEIANYLPIAMPEWAARLVGIGLLAAVAFYVAGSLLHLKPLVIRGFSIFYPRPPIVFRQLIIGPMELIGAAAIVYFCLPTEGNPGFIIVLGVFLASFGAAIFSHAPGGIGVLEFLFVTALSGTIPAADVLAALIVFRLFYLVIPLAISVVVVLLFERQQIMERRRAAGIAAAPAPAGTDPANPG
jgi:uncharacterized membrane protein YbhN (UPF0104 family)